MNNVLKYDATISIDGSTTFTEEQYVIYLMRKIPWLNAQIEETVRDGYPTTYLEAQLASHKTMLSNLFKKLAKELDLS